MSAPADAVFDTPGFRRLCHWGPMVALSIIFYISSVAIMCTLMWWPPTTVGGFNNLALFVLWIYLTLHNYFLAAIRGPGFVPYKWKPKSMNDTRFLQYCYECDGYKVPRSHHCRKCNRCCMKMDHHCPWINTCCGHVNHANFVYFLFFAPCGCIHANVIVISSVLKALNVHYYMYHMPEESTVELSLVGFIIVMFAIGLSIGVIVAVGMLLVIQMKVILKNETGIESWIISKASYRGEEDEQFVYPYNVGWKRNLKLVFSWSQEFLSDGITWPVLSQCTQHTFTIEQIRQKMEKKEHTQPYRIVENYSGSWLPVSKGCRVICNIPITDEPRIALKRGDCVLVTRGKRHWLYGIKILPDTNKKRIRGWFPTRCGVADDENNFQKRKN